MTLDGSGSDGGPWGTNVTYSWAASGAAVTFDDAASATPVVTIPALADGTELTFTLTVTGRATNAVTGSAPDTDTATVTVVGVPELSFAPNLVTVNEDAVSATLTVELDPASTGTVTVDYATRDGVGAAKAGEDYTATSGTLTFAATETSKTFTVPILDDDVYENNESFSVDLTNPTGATLVASGATVRIDSEDAVPTASMADVTVDEGAGTMTLTLQLSHPSQPDITYLTSASNVTGTATEGDDYDDFLLSGGRTARITVPGGDLSQTFDITIVDDSVDEPDETIDIGWQKGASDEAIPITFTFIGTFTDNDTAGVTVSKTSLTVTEADTTGDSYTVVLDNQPTASVVVTVAGHAGTEVLPAPTTLTFTSTTWNTPQPVTVTAADDTDTANDTVTLTHSAASTDSDYDAIVIGGVTVTVEDHDTAQVTGVMVAPGNARLTVGWAAVANATGYEVQWKSGGQSYNTSDRQATVASGSTTSHTLPGLANDTEYTVRVRATRTGANDGPYSDEEMATPKAAGITVSKTSLTVTEEDTTGDSYTVVLDSQPTASVVVTVAGHAGTEVLPAPTTLTFTSTTWNTPQPVTVTAADDTDTANDTVTLTHSAASTDSDYDAIVIGGVTVTVEDHDTAQVTGVMVAPGNARLTVGWAAVANATGYEVQWKSGGQSYNTSDRQATVASGSTTSHTLPGLANDTEYTVRVRATRTGANDGPYSDEEMATPKAAGITVSKTSLTVTEEDTTGDSYTVVLDSQPTASVVVTVAGHAGTEVLPAPTTLTFTSTTWNTPQPVTVTAADDTDTANDTVTLTHSAASTDSDYDAIVIGGVTVTVEDHDTAQVTGVMVAPGNARLTVGWAAVANATGYEVQWKSGGQSYNTSDRQATVASGSTTSHTLPGLANDTEYTVRVRATRTGANDGPYSDEEMATPKAAGVTVSKMALTVTEADTTGDSYTVVLDNQPTASVVVTVAGHAGTEVLPAPTTLTFTTVNWETAQEVTVTATDDADAVDDTVTLTHSAASTDSDYDAIVIGGVTVTVEDHDTANSAPTFTSAATFDAAENQTAVGTVVASDGDADDSVTGYAIQGGADRSTFSIVETTGVLTFASAPNFEAPADADTDNGYVVVVRATSGTGARAKTADQTITVTVTDVAGEAPGVPAAPMVSAASVTSVTAAWTAPANAGPPITDYDYRYRVTSPQGAWTEVTTTAITGLSATITGLAEDTEYEVQVRATTDEGTSGWSLSGSGSTDANAAPAFTSAATFDAAENQTAVGTVVASDGDADDSVTGYAIQGGADASTFSIVPATGVLTFASAPNFEAPADADADNGYVVVVRATSGTGARAKTADQTITVTVTDVAGEAPGVPAAPMVSAASVTSVTAAWTAPANAGPPITDYDYRYRVTSPQGAWTEVTTTTITALAEDTGYDVQVRATTDEGTSGWSAAGSGSTDANAAPAFTSAATFDAAENQTAVGTVVASDSDTDDSVTGYAIQGGADRSTFSIVETTGVLTFASAPNFEAPADADTDNGYVVVVRATSGTGARAKTADQTITVTVTDVAGEAPGVPAAPMVSAASATSVTAAWTAPANAGPPITDYDYRYRVKAPQGPWTEVTTTAITGLSVTITGLAEDTEYEVQVRATTDEGTSGWSASGSGSMNANNTPATGQPTISGVAQVGSLLTAGKGTIADVNGTTKADNGDSGYAYTYQWIRVDGGTETNISDATSSTYTPVDDDEGKKIKVGVSFQDDANHSESKTSAATATVTGNDNDTGPALSIADASAAENAGHLLFEVTLSRAFQNTVKVDFETISGGTATEGEDYHARRTYTHVIPGRETTVQMGFALIEDTDNDAGETVKVRLSNARVVDAYGDKIKDLDITRAEATGTITAPPTTTTTVPGLTIRIRDATGDEDNGYLDFRVRLSRKHNDYVCYDFESIAGGTAAEGTDYLKFPKATYWMQIGKRVDTPFVRIIDDSVNDNGETVKVKISNARLCNDPSQTVSITRAEATGTIRNSDPLPQALMARFGRTAAVHVVEHVEERLAAPREVGVEAQVAGRQLRPGMERELALDFLRQLGSSAGMHAVGAGSPGARSGPPMGAAAGSLGLAAGMGGPAGGGMGLAADPMNGMAGPDGGLFDRGLRSMGLGGERLLTRSYFALTRETRQGGILSFWSRGARSSFTGREAALSLGGEMRTTMVGADYAKGPLVTGLSLSNSRGLGEYAGVSAGQVASAVTGLYPWLGYTLSDRVSVWGVTGYGKGALTLTPGEGAALTSGLSMAMAAAGTRGALVAGGASGFELAFKADALWVGTSIDGVEGPGGNVAATAAAVTRFRTGLEGARDYTLGRLSLRPSVEVGLRHDGGDAETGAGLDVGGGLVVSDASTGLTVDVRVRMLVVHQADGFSERGMALSLSYNPTPSTPLGLTARVAPSWGGEATSGAEAMWGRETMAGMANGGLASGNRLDGEVGYGLRVGSCFVGTPRVGVSTSEYGRDYRIGYDLGVLDRERLNLELGVAAHRRESPMRDGTDNGFLGRATLGW